LIELSPEQRHIAEKIIVAGKGKIFTISGKAGAGKSVLVNHIKQSGNWIVLGPTGLAAKLVSGPTIHSFLGIRGGEPVDKVVKNLKRPNNNALSAADGVIIDEKSMVRADLLDACDRIFRISQRKQAPFGGKTLVLVGDAFQIPPVVNLNKEDDARLFSSAGIYTSPWFFDSRVIFEHGSQGFELTHSFRQQGDLEFLDALNCLQTGDTSMLHVFNRHVGKAKRGQLVLAFTNRMADAINLRAIESIPGEEKVWKAWSKDVFASDYPSPEHLVLKIGCRVLVTANGDGYVNGDQGMVMGWTKGTVTVLLDSGDEIVFAQNVWRKIEYVSTENGIIENEVGSFAQIPLKLAYAITVHKSQGQTFDGGHILMDRKPWDHGMLYVALSRFRALANVTIRRELVPSDVIVDPRVLEWYKNLDRVQAA